jgi:hypothetical protein
MNRFVCQFKQSLSDVGASRVCKTNSDMTPVPRKPHLRNVSEKLDPEYCVFHVPWPKPFFEFCEPFAEQGCQNPGAPVVRIASHESEILMTRVAASSPSITGRGDFLPEGCAAICQHRSARRTGTDVFAEGWMRKCWTEVSSDKVLMQGRED